MDPIFTPAPKPRRHKRKTIQTNSPPVEPLILTACDWEPGATITMTFDRAIDVSGMEGSQIQVVDGSGTGFLYAATGEAEMIDPTTIVIALNVVEASFDPGPRLNASASNGIVASDDEGAWAGIENAPIPL